MLNSKQLRELYRKWLFDNGAKPSYTKQEYKMLIKAHIKTLKKYWSQIHKYFKIKYGIKMYTTKPTIRDVLEILLRNKDVLFNDFLSYLKGKTHFSYELYQKPEIYPSEYEKQIDFMNHLNTRNEKDASANKLGEFVFIILSEYIVLHNYMWVSGIKPKGIKTIDKFLDETI